MLLLKLGQLLKTSGYIQVTPDSDTHLCVEKNDVTLEFAVVEKPVIAYVTSKAGAKVNHKTGRVEASVTFVDDGLPSTKYSLRFTRSGRSSENPVFLAAPRTSDEIAVCASLIGSLLQGCLNGLDESAKTELAALPAEIKAKLPLQETPSWPS